MQRSGVSVGSLAGYLVGVALGTFCLTLVYLGMRAVMDVGGACADGGPFVSAQPCPDGAAVALTGGILGLFAAAGLMIWFGSRLGAGYVALVGLGWPALFLSLGFNFLQYGVDPPGPEPGPVWGWLIPGVIFWVMGGIPLLAGVAGWRAARSGRSQAAMARLAARMKPRRPEELRIEFAPHAFGVPRPAATGRTTADPPMAQDAEPPAPAPVAADLGGDDIDEVLVSQLERLGALRDSGSLTDEEFAAAKARILANERLDG